MNKVVLVGCGYWGKNWYNTLTKRDDVEIVAVIDPNPSIPVNNQYNSLTEFNAASLKYNKVIIAVQAEYHKAYYTYFLTIPWLRETDILIEKPCGLPEDKKSLLGCFPGYIFLSSPQYKIIKEMLSTKMLGNIMYSTFKRASMGPRLRTDVDIIDDYMIHDLYLYNGLFKNGFADTISGNVMKNFGKDIKHDTACVTIDYLDTVTTFFSSWNYPRKERLIEIVGDRGSIIWKDDKVTFIRSYYNNINGEDKYRNQGYELIEGYEIDITPEITKSNLDLEFDDFVNYEYRQEIQVLTNQLILDIKEKLLYSNE